MYAVIVVICICVHCGPSIESRLYAISLVHTINAYRILHHSFLLYSFFGSYYGHLRPPNKTPALAQEWAVWSKTT